LQRALTGRALICAPSDITVPPGMCRGEIRMNWMIMPYQRYFEFSGRSRRKEYWMFTLLQLLIIIGITGIAFLVGGQDQDTVMTVLVIGVIIYALATFIPSLAVQVRRFHDQDLSGWLVLLGFIPYVGGLIILVFMCIDGKRGPNKYGPDPKGGVDPSVFA
jgi:uncharacterized membrane protein YhaH (DUF805 family)